ncbi:MAG: hypothetical protein V2I33_21700 [Kangiellaceae bacterium]|nr:hypothetical protein [Kangiellaceae bacterium]
MTHKLDAGATKVFALVTFLAHSLSVWVTTVAPAVVAAVEEGGVRVSAAEKLAIEAFHGPVDLLVIVHLLELQTSLTASQSPLDSLTEVVHLLLVRHQLLLRANPVRAFGFSWHFCARASVAAVEEEEA